MFSEKDKNPIDIINEVKKEMGEEVRPLVENKKKSKKIKSNNEGVEILSSIEAYDFGDQSCRRKKVKVKDRPLSEWNNANFFEYSHGLYKNRYGKYWDLRRGGNYIILGKVRDKISDCFGFYSNFIMKDYLDYYFSKKADFYSKNGNDFYLNPLLKDSVISEFDRHYDFNKRFYEYSSTTVDEKGGYVVKSDLEKAYSVGETNLVGNYGLVLSLNWLLLKYDKKKSISIVMNACKKLLDRGHFDMVLSSTERYSPYSNKLAFKKPELILKRFDKEYSLVVNFEECSNCDFLIK